MIPLSANKDILVNKYNNINMEKTEKTNRSFEYSFSLHFHLGIFIVP